MSGRTHIPDDAFISLRNGDEDPCKVWGLRGRTETKASDPNERGSSAGKQKVTKKRYGECHVSLCTCQNRNFCRFESGGKNRERWNNNSRIAETLIPNHKQSTKKLRANVLKARLLQLLGISQPESAIKTSPNLSRKPRNSECYTGVNCLDACNFNLFFMVVLFL